jgi:hypothetical protein
VQLPGSNAPLGDRSSGVERPCTFLDGHIQNHPQGAHRVIVNACAVFGCELPRLFQAILFADFAHRRVFQLWPRFEQGPDALLPINLRPLFNVLLTIQALTEDANGVPNSHSTRADCRVITHLLLPFFYGISKPQFGYAEHIGLETVSKKLAPDAQAGEIDA